mmetsp:Transcript_46024/g.76661  ORF Transcript_46024/g.76661 Transcript_46024/m.76661 type:complete len:82 (-) Transcript_46024:312-557(-)
MNLAPLSPHIKCPLHTDTALPYRVLTSVHMCEQPWRTISRMVPFTQIVSSDHVFFFFRTPGTLLPPSFMFLYIRLNPTSDL